MSEPFLGELKIFSFVNAPRGWAQCNGQLLPINQNQALFSLFGTTYGGDGQVTFALPNLRGRCAMHLGAGFIQGQIGGTEAHTLSIQELPAHTHLVTASTANADQPIVTNNVLASFNNGYRAFSAPQAIVPQTIGNTGGSQPHPNVSPFLTLNFCTALIGIFPSRN